MFFADDVQLTVDLNRGPSHVLVARRLPPTFLLSVSFKHEPQLSQELVCSHDVLVKIASFLHSASQSLLFNVRELHLHSGLFVLPKTVSRQFTSSTAVPLRHLFAGEQQPFRNPRDMPVFVHQPSSLLFPLRRHVLPLRHVRRCPSEVHPATSVVGVALLDITSPELRSVRVFSMFSLCWYLDLAPFLYRATSAALHLIVVVHVTGQ